MYVVIATKGSVKYVEQESPVAVYHVENKPAGKRLKESLKAETVYGVPKFRRVDIRPVVFEKV